jgi:serine/threonine-protein kinase
VGAERFLAEIKTTANLQHPHILPLHDSGEADGLLFYVMPYVQGETLRDRLDREHQLPVDEAVQIATHVAQALDYAHRHGVIHRDIKPANILLHDGQPVVSDFGIALAVTMGGAGRLTETGLSLGTPHYMSPEQATGDQSVGPATDVYALGCVLYEMLAGEPPYTGSTPQAILGKIIQAKAVAVTEVRATVPPNVSAAIRKALEKVPADRFGSASAFAAAVGDAGFRHGELVGIGGAGAASVARGNRLTVTFASLAAVFALVLTWVLLRPEVPEPVERFEIVLPGGWEGLFGTGPEITISPDGSQLVYAGAPRGLAPQLLLRRLDQLTTTPIPGSEGGRNPVFSPDGTAVAFTAGGGLIAVSLTGAPPLTLVSDAVSPQGLAWGADGWIYYKSGVGIWRVSEGGGQPEPVTPPDGNEYVWPSALPGGRGLLITLDRGGPTGDEIAVWNAGSGEVRTLLQGAAAHHAGSGHVLYTSGEGTLMAAPFDLERLDLTAPARTLLEGIQVNSGSASYFSLSGNGALFYWETAGTPEAGRRLAVVDLEGNQRVLPLGPREYAGGYGPSWSPDGASIVFASDQRIYTYNTVLNTTPRQITFEGSSFFPVYSPDGARVAFSSEARGNGGYDIFVKNLNDDTPARSLLALETDQMVMGWPADTLIVFMSGGRLTTGNYDLWLVDLSDPDRPEPRPYLTSEAVLGPVAISPDGTLAAYASDETGTSEIYVRSFPNPGERTLVSQGGGEVPFWSPDGSTLYYQVGAVIFAAQLQRGPVPVVQSLDTAVVASGYAWLGGLHPDGDRFIVPVNASEALAASDAPTSQRLVLVQNFFTELLERVGESR